MLSRLQYFIFLTLFISLPVYSSNYALFVGGAESSSEKTQFNFPFLAFSRFGSVRPEWKTSVLYKKSSAIVSEDFTSEKFKRKLIALKKQIRRGTIKEGDQLLIYIDTHGSPQEPGQQTHSVDTLGGSFDLDYLKSVRDLAEKKGIKLAFVDQSCFSGALLDLSTDKTCVVSSTTKDNYGYTQTSVVFAMRLALEDSSQTRSLEEIFLRSRESNFSPGQPMISTDAGRKAALIVETFNRTYYGDKFLQEKNSCQGTSLDLRSQALNTQLVVLKQLIKDPEVYNKASRQMKDALDLKFNMIKKGEAFEQTEQGKRVFVCGDRLITYSEAMDKNIKIEGICVSSAEEAQQNLENMRQMLSSAQTSDQSSASDFLGDKEPPKNSKEPSADQLKGYINSIEKMMTSEAYKKMIQININQQKDLEKKEENHSQRVKDLSAKERELYKTLYDYFKSESKAPNPCADFKI